MRDFINWLFIGHTHKWKIISTDKLYRNGDITKLPVAIEYTLQCVHCGNIKSKRV